MMDSIYGKVWVAGLSNDCFVIRKHLAENPVLVCNMA